MRPSRRHFVLGIPGIGFVVAILCAPCAAQDVGIEHPVYTFLERCESRGLLDHPLPSTLPLSRQRIVALLEEAGREEQHLTVMERRQWTWYMTEFSAAGGRLLSDRHRRLPLYQNRRDLYSRTHDDWDIYVNPVISATAEHHTGDIDSLTGELSIWGSGLNLHGRVRTFTFFANATDQHVRGRTELADPSLFPYRYGWQTKGFDFDEALAGIGWESKWIDATFGKSRNRWGPARHNALTLSSRPTSYTHFRSRFRLGPLELTSLQARLQQYPPLVTAADTTADGIYRPQYADKYFAAHRLEWNVNGGLQVGLNEAVVYGERGFDFEYLHPLMFLRSAEHYAGDRDNALIGGDVKWRALTGILLYGELLVDDVTTTRLGTGWFGNKFAWQAGARLHDPWSGNLRLVCEYARVEPYVYSHKFPINSYQHYGTLLGATIGPNSDALNASLSWTALRALEVEGWGRVVRHGANPPDGRNVGGDYTRTWVSSDPKTVRFLDGELRKTTSAGFRARYELFYNLFAHGSLQSDWSLLGNDARQETLTHGYLTTVGFDWNRR